MKYVYKKFKKLNFKKVCKKQMELKEILSKINPI